MSLRLTLLNFVLRAVEKPYLARATDVAALRRQFDRAAERWFIHPEGARYRPYRLGGVKVLEASQGRVDRRRVLIWFHGGGFFQGSPETHRHLGAALSARCGARVILPRYRLTPEHAYPAALEDARACYEALLRAGYDPAHIAFGGDSAGGGLAFSLVLDAHARGLPAPACVVAFCPWTDLTLSSASLRRNARRDVMLPFTRLAEVRDTYLNGADPQDPLVSPARARFPEGPPPALIQASRVEILEDDASAIGARLQAAGGLVRMQFWRRTFHVWQLLQGRLQEADQALDQAGAFLALHLGKTEPEEG
ncbi:alpha/beta hydrolase [Oceanicella sp. SM1341]|uniref:alpha/beta hydrolase n=1 Tax=Oceanicella sp. SM1341 TaxID=1548889 RepID=UPI0013006BBF|nr:alpha/beta hydrolase [Oceanicella sp. SM1341]